MRARGRAGLSARLGRGALKRESVTLPPDTDQPLFPGRAHHPGSARAGSRVTGCREAGQMPAPVRGGAASRSLSPRRAGTVGRAAETVTSTSIPGSLAASVQPGRQHSR